MRSREGHRERETAQRATRVQAQVRRDNPALARFEATQQALVDGMDRVLSGRPRARSFDAAAEEYLVQWEAEHARSSRPRPLDRLRSSRGGARARARRLAEVMEAHEGATAELKAIGQAFDAARPVVASRR